MKSSNLPDLVLHNGRITTLDPKHPEASNLAVKDGRIIGVDDAEEYQGGGPNTKVIDLKGRRVVPGLNDSHLHVIRGGLNYNMELRWDGLPSLADALRMLKEQARRTPPGQWIRVVGGWTEFQFAERRMPTLEEVNAAAPETPVLPEWSPAKVFGGYGAPLDIRKAARAGVPVQHLHNAECHQHGCCHALQQLFTAAEIARNRYAEFFGPGCDCFAF
jgi:hypothetical protein